MSNAEIDILDGLPRSARAVYNFLELKGARKSYEIKAGVPYSHRTVRSALRRLESRKLIKKIPDLHDLRSWFYIVRRGE